MIDSQASPAFPPLSEIAALGHSEYEREFLGREFGPGLQYHLDRLDRLMFSGDTLLDAGCGAGQWSLAAAQRFRRVHAIDVNEPRLAVLREVAARMGTSNIHCSRGALESLPYAAQSFDAVWCYGVITFTDPLQTLAEFHRVLKPSGRIYICLSADGWSRYLIAERGPTDPRALAAGRDTLYNTHWRRAIAAGLGNQLVRAATQLRSPVPTWLAKLWWGPPRRMQLSPRRHRRAINMGRRSLLTSAAGESLLQQITRDCGPEAVETACLDAWLIGSGLGTFTPRIRAEAFEPQEMRTLVESAGFSNFEWAPENGLVCDWLTPAPPNKYDGHYRGHLAVWEAVATKPATQRVSPAPERHYLAAREARRGPIYLANADPTVISNNTWDVYPQALVDYAQELGHRLGGEQYLAALARHLVEHAGSDDEAARRIITFVQRAIFRDPISQPLFRNGSMPDSLTILLCSRGRCGHASQLLVDMFRLAGIDARLLVLTNHMVAEAFVQGRWIVADADAFKNGIIPTNRDGQLLSLADVEADPYWLDTFQPTGWWMRRHSRFARSQNGRPVTGYVDALDPHQRGFVSGYYVPRVREFPTPIPEITRFESTAGAVLLEWRPVPRAVEYRVAIGTESRQWSYDEPGAGDEILCMTAGDVAQLTTSRISVEAAAPAAPKRLYASVTAASDRAAVEPRTFFWPSEEVRL